MTWKSTRIGPRTRGCPVAACFRHGIPVFPSPKPIVRSRIESLFSEPFRQVTESTCCAEAFWRLNDGGDCHVYAIDGRNQVVAAQQRLPQKLGRVDPPPHPPRHAPDTTRPPTP